MIEHEELNHIFLAVLLFGVVIAGVAFGFSNPTQAPPNGTAGVVVDSATGNLGIEVVNPLSKVSIGGIEDTAIANFAIGNIFYDLSTPQDSLSVEGNVVIGNSSLGDSKAKLYIEGAISLNGILMRGFPNERIPVNNSDSILPVTGGRYIAMAIGSDGYPMLTRYRAATPSTYYFIKCTTINCSVFNEIAIEETPGLTAIPSNTNSLIVDLDGFPVMAYNFSTESAGNYGARVTKCGDSQCNLFSSYTIHDDSLNPSLQISGSSSIELGGTPIIAYYTNTQKELAFVRCRTVTCEDVDSDGPIYLDQVVLESNVKPPGVETGVVSLAVAYDGNPMMVYLYRTNSSTPSELHFIKCNDLDCSDISGPTTLDVGSVPALATFSYTSLTTKPDGFAILSYNDENSDLVVISCTNKDCTNFDKNIIDSTIKKVTENEITIGADGIPLILYKAGDELRAAKCGNQQCSSGINSKTLVASDINQALPPLLGPDGLPITAYRKNSTNQIHILNCGSSRCINNWTRR